MNQLYLTIEIQDIYLLLEDEDLLVGGPISINLLKFMGSLAPLSSPLVLSHSYSEQVKESSSLSSSLELLVVVLPDPTILLVGVLVFFRLPLPMLTRSRVFTKVEVFFGVVLRCALLNLKKNIQNCFLKFSQYIYLSRK